ncbi:MAG: tyrosine-type recombinase/integrase [Gammaproteobacteria bacterium]|nr:tyrosine-type recombinase/integrase [Gammaproteobacteria bacterium]
MTTSISDHVARFVAMKQALGYRFTQNERILKRFARFAEARGETFIRAATVLEWASASQTASRTTKVRLLRFVRDFALWLHAEDDRHEVPHRDALGRRSSWRPRPYLISVPDIRKLLDAALSRGPAGTIAPLTWHYMFGLMAATGLRIGEALALTLDDITDDGVVIRDTKFGKTRLVVLHPTSREALDLYLAARLKERTPDRHLFVIATGRPPRREHADNVFRELAEQVGLRKPGAKRGPTPHSLRHSFAVRSLENLPPGTKPGRHMLALATYLGHAEFMSTHWYLEATPILLRGIAAATEQAHGNGGSHD